MELKAKSNNFRVHRKKFYFGFVGLFLIIGVMTFATKVWQSSAQNLQSQQSETVFPETNSVKFDELIKKASEKSLIPVIIGFRFNFTPEGYLTEPSKESQRADIKQNQDLLLQKLEPFKPDNVKRFESIPYFAVTVDVKTLEFLKSLPEVTFIREDEAHAPNLFESTQVVRAPQAWNLGFSGQGQVVAILDTGVDKNHPFLAGKVISEACYSTTFAPQGYSSVCPGGVSSTTAANSGLHCTFSTGCNHGTHVAGIAAGRLPSSSFYGVARDANLVAIQVFSRVDNASICTEPNESSPCVRTTDWAYTAGLERVLALKQSGVNISSANMSLVGGRFFSNCDASYPDVKMAIDHLRSVGVATVISSGNDGYSDSIGTPACISSAVSVGSTGDGSGGATIDVVSSFSNSSSFLNLLAPGQVIQSSVPGGYGFLQGTSMAAPHVAGAWAILKQRNPNATVAQISNALSTTGQPITDSRNGIVKPRINIEAALGTLPCLFPITVGQTINGSLITSDCAFTGTTRYVDVYVFDGTAGQQIAISMNSVFDTYLYLVSSSNQILDQNDDSGGGTNSRIPVTSGFFTLPTTSTYSIYATSLSPNATGAYTINLLGNCSYSIGPMSQNFAAVGGNGSINVTALPGCAWTATSNAGWISITSGSSGNGNGTVNFSVATNTGIARTGTITAAGQTFTVTQNAGTTVVNRKPFDFDGDGKTDLSIFRPSVGEWWYLKSSDGGNAAAQFGASTDKITPGDFTGDGKTDIAFWRPSNGFWFVLRSEDSSFYAFPWGTNGDIPAVGDFDGDGKADATIFRPSNSTWYISKSTGGTIIQTFGASGDAPVVADYDGDGKSDIAIFRPSVGEWWMLRSSLGLVAYQFGASGDKAVQGDYTGDGKADIAIWRPSNGTWFVLRSEDNSYYAFPWGISSDVPAPGDYDGDGKFDAGIFRPSNSTWYIQRSTAGILVQGFGQSGDQPVPNAFVP